MTKHAEEVVVTDIIGEDYAVIVFNDARDRVSDLMGEDLPKEIKEPYYKYADVAPLINWMRETHGVVYSPELRVRRA